MGQIQWNNSAFVNGWPLVNWKHESALIRHATETATINPGTGRETTGYEFHYSIGYVTEVYSHPSINLLYDDLLKQSLGYPAENMNSCIKVHAQNQWVVFSNLQNLALRATFMHNGHLSLNIPIPELLNTLHQPLNMKTQAGHELWHYFDYALPMTLRDWEADVELVEAGAKYGKLDWDQCLVRFQTPESLGYKYAVGRLRCVNDAPYIDCSMTTNPLMRTMLLTLPGYEDKVTQVMEENYTPGSTTTFIQGDDGIFSFIPLLSQTANLFIEDHDNTDSADLIV